MEISSEPQAAVAQGSAATGTHRTLDDSVVRHNTTVDDTVDRPSTTVDDTIDPNVTEAISAIIFTIENSGTPSSNDTVPPLVSLFPGDPFGLSDYEINALDDRATRRGSRVLRRLVPPSIDHPELPPAPARHPSTHRKNNYKPEEAFQPGKRYQLLRLHDRWGNPPHRCYLVEWRGTPTELSWVWAENLVGHEEMMRQVDAWKDSGSSEAFMAYHKVRYSGATASESGLCFLDAVRMALAYLGAPSLVTLELWDAFEEQHSRSLEYGVRRGDAAAFYEYLQRLDIPLDYDALLRKRLEGSISDIEHFITFARSLPRGVYVSCAGDDMLQHCFVLVVSSPADITVLDGYDESQTPPYTTLKFEDQLWIKNVRFLHLMALVPQATSRHGKRPSRSEKDASKRMKLDQFFQQF